MYSSYFVVCFELMITPVYSLHGSGPEPACLKTEPPSGITVCFGAALFEARRARAFSHKVGDVEDTTDDPEPRSERWSRRRMGWGDLGCSLASPNDLENAPKV